MKDHDLRDALFFVVHERPGEFRVVYGPAEYQRADAYLHRFNEPKAFDDQAFLAVGVRDKDASAVDDFLNERRCRKSLLCRVSDESAKLLKANRPLLREVVDILVDADDDRRTVEYWHNRAIRAENKAEPTGPEPRTRLVRAKSKTRRKGGAK